MNNQIQNMEDHIKNIEEFIQHNLKLGYLKEEMTIKDLLKFTKSITENYSPMLQHIINTLNL